MDLLKKILSIGLILPLFFSYSDTRLDNLKKTNSIVKIIPTNKTEKPEEVKTSLYPRIYNRLTGEFLEKEKGIAEKIINKNIQYFDKDEIGVYEIIDSAEVNSKFENPDGKGARLSGLDDVPKIIENYYIIQEVDNTKSENLSKEYLPLKKLLNKLNNIYEKDSSHNYQNLKKMYLMIGENIDPNIENADLSIQDILSGKGGVCRDIISVYYPILDYYGFDVGVKFGKIDDILHVWLSAKLQGEYFELDPSFHTHYMVPLEKRLDN